MEPMEYDSDTDCYYKPDVSVESPMQHSGWDGLREEIKQKHNHAESDFRSIIKEPSPRSRWNTYHNIVSAVNAFTGFNLMNENSAQDTGFNLMNENSAQDTGFNLMNENTAQDGPHITDVHSAGVYRPSSLESSASSSKPLYPDLSQLMETQDHTRVLSEEYNELFSSAISDELTTKTKRRKLDSARPVTVVTDSPIRKLCKSSVNKKPKRLKARDLDNVKSKPTKTSGVKNTRPCTKIVLFLSVIICIFIVFSYYAKLNPNCSSYTDINFSELTSVITLDLYGQHIASHIIATELKKYFLEYSSSLLAVRPLVFSLHGWTGVGKNYITWLIYHFLPQTTVTKFLIPFHFAHESKSDIYSDQIFQWLISNVTECKVNIFILDEMDKAPAGVISGLSAAISNLSVLDTKPAPVIIFLLSNSKGTEITRKVLFEEDSSKQRESFALEDFKDLFWQDESLWYSHMLSRNLISAVVPFLPLERRHVIKCIKRDILSKGYEVNDNLVEQVLREMSFFAVASGKQYSQTGCKRVSDKVDLVHVH